MKKTITIYLFLISFVSFAQHIDDRMERIKSLRVAFISDKLQLTPEEAQKFWPIFNQFDEKQFELQRQKRLLMTKLRPEKSNNLSEKESSQLIAEDEKIETEIQNNRRLLAKNLQGIIPTQKILKLRQIEIEFKQKLLNQIQKRKEGRFRR